MSADMPELGQITVNGDALTDMVPITFGDPGNGAVGGWRGSFKLPEGVTFNLNVGCGFRMADGRLADIVPFRRDAGRTAP